MITPKIIYLTKDREDDSHTIWQIEKPVSHDEGAMYIREDYVNDFASQQADSADPKGHAPGCISTVSFRAHDGMRCTGCNVLLMRSVQETACTFCKDRIEDNLNKFCAVCGRKFPTGD